VDQVTGFGTFLTFGVCGVGAAKNTATLERQL
jgi:hypothetical protein